MKEVGKKAGGKMVAHMKHGLLFNLEAFDTKSWVILFVAFASTERGDNASQTLGGIAGNFFVSSSFELRVLALNSWNLRE